MLTRRNAVTTDVVLNLTLRCPLRCSHCCYRSGPKASGVMSTRLMSRTIRSAASLGSVRTVHFSGGEPFLVPDLLISGVRLATRLGLRSAAVTSAYFAGTPGRAKTAIAPVAAAGLRELSVSYDDIHAAFVSPEHVVNAIDCATRFGLDVFVSVTVEPGSRIDAAHVRRLLGLAESDESVRVLEVGLNTTGRAADLADEAGRTARASGTAAYRGPCRSVLCTIQVTADGRVLPCCGVLPHSERMQIGSMHTSKGLLEAVQSARQDPLWRRIAAEGPVTLLAEATAGTDHAIAPNRLDGLCAACDRIFNDSPTIERVRRMASSYIDTPRNTRAMASGFSRRTRET